MRILFVNEKCGYFGGVEQNVADSASELRRRGHDCFLASGPKTSRGGDDYAALFDARFPCREMGADEGRPFDDIFREAAPDVLYVHKTRSIAPLLPHLSACRSVRMVHDHDLCCPRRLKYYVWTGRVCRCKAGWRCWCDLGFLERNRERGRGYRLASIAAKLEEIRRNYQIQTFLVGSRFMREELAQNGFPEDRLRILPPVVRMHYPEPAPVTENNTVLFVGQLTHNKGVDLLLHALARVRCEFSASIVGEGAMRPRLEALASRLKLTDRVRFEGWIDHSRIGEYYAKAKISVAPSRWPEPFGMVGLEAMHHGRAVVGFDVGGISDWLEHECTGLLVPEQDVHALAAAIDRLLTHPELAEHLGRNGYERVNKRFAFSRYIEQLEAILAGDASAVEE